RSEDRLQGRAPAAALHFRARQDRAVADHGGQPEEAARTRQGDQARPFPGAAALRRKVGRIPARVLPAPAPPRGGRGQAEQQIPSWASDLPVILRKPAIFRIMAALTAGQAGQRNRRQGAFLFLTSSFDQRLRAISPPWGIERTEPWKSFFSN